MSTKKINLNAIRGLSYSMANENIIAFETGTPSGIADGDFTPSWIEDESQELLGSCLRGLYQTSRDMGDTVQNYSDYIVAVAQAFEDQDLALASDIDAVSVKTISAPKSSSNSSSMDRSETLRIRQSEAIAALQD